MNQRNIVLKNTVNKYDYVSAGRVGKFSYPKRDKNEHAKFIKNLIEKSYLYDKKQRQVIATRHKKGIYLEFASAPSYDLEIRSLENRTNGISLLNVHENKETGVIKATVYIPEGKESFFLKKIEEYQYKNTKKGNPKNEKLVASIDDVRCAVVESFWFGNKDAMPKINKKWCEVWFRVPVKKNVDTDIEKVESEINDVCLKLNIQIKPERIIFPERIVKLIYASEDDLINLIYSYDCVAEIRQAIEPTSFLLSLKNSEQKDWNKNLLERTKYSFDDTSICLLDTGLNRRHELLEKATNDMYVQTIESTWGENDHSGHGTLMAGIALYYDLKDRLLSNEKVVIKHKVESVKILPPKGENPIELYGDLTQRAINIAEIANPSAKRIICMAVTSSDINTEDGSPTSWSGAIDNIVSGAFEENVKRLVIISAGNVQISEISKLGYPNANREHAIENPGQAWNAITVGAYSGVEKIDDEKLEDYKAVSREYELSPYSATSYLWSNKWPIKPDVLFMGGNVATNGIDYTECDDLSILTTSHKPLTRQYDSINATSAATAQAAWFAAQLVSEYPELWPETIRALMIHSARWTDDMKREFCETDKKSKGRKELLRTCGYGIPNLNNAIRCFNNSVNMIVESELQPFTKKSMNEMHIHKVPWPKELLISLGNIPVTLRVTLSYFVQPGPGEIGWRDKYRYPSCGLRFDVINGNESLEDFKKRINVKMRGDNIKDKGEGTSGSERWYLGAENRDVGSIHSDMMIDINASDLCNCEYFAVYPVVGWWRERGYLGKSESKQRYSLIISLSTPNEEVNLYSAIQTKIGNIVQVSL